MSSKIVPVEWFAPQMTGHELKNLEDVLTRNFINDGPLTKKFEKRVAAIVGVKHAVAVPNGTIALTIALMALGVGVGDEVIVPNLTFIATANAVRLAAIMPVDVNGRGADYGRLEKICHDHGLLLVCDSAEAFGSAYNGRGLGSFGDAAALSFSANKTISTGQGGMLLTNRLDVYERANQLKDQGRLKRGSGGDDLHPTQGYNFKFTDLQAAVGMAQLNEHESRCRSAKVRDSWYRDALSGIVGLEFPDYSSQSAEVRQWTDVLIDQREKVQTALSAEKIGHRAFWFPISTQEPYLANGDDFSVSSRICARGLWLPSYFNITEEVIDRVSGVIKAALT
jgi:perosamine synthetase